MKIACIGDIHAHRYKEFDFRSELSGSTRLDAILNTMNEIGSYCVINDIPLLIIAGDVFHTRGKVDTVTMNNMYNCISDISCRGIKVLIVIGNHDMSGNGEDAEHSIHTFSKIPNVIIADTISTVWINDISFLCIPYTRSRESVLDAVATNSASILIAHLGVSGAEVGKTNYVMQDVFSLEDFSPDKFKYIVLGHYHKPQMIKGSQNAFYCGAPIQHSFNDEGDENGFFVIDTDKRYSIKFVPIPNSQFVTIKGVPDEDELIAHADRRNYLRVQLKESEVRQFQSIVPQDLLYRIELQKEFKQETRVDVKVGMSFAEIISKYADEFCPDAKHLGLDILKEAEGV